MTFPSRRCRTCKQRRLKCDGVQPTCGRCGKASRDCVWNPNDETGLYFKSENAFAQGQPRRPKRMKEHHPDQLALRVHTPPNVPRAQSIPMELRAFNYWLENFVFQPDDLPDIGHEYSTYVLSHWFRAGPGSSLQLALAALSHAVFGKVMHVNEAIEDAERLYAKTIVKTQKETRELSNESIDQLLLTIMLLNTHENIMYRSRRPDNQDPSSSRADEVGSRFWKRINHIKGAVGLLKLRRQQGSPPNLPLNKVIRRQIIRTTILRGVTIPEWLQDGAEYGERGPALEFDSFMVRTGALRDKSLKQFSGKISNLPLSAHYLEEVATEAQDLDTALASWSRSLPEDWKFSTQPSSTTHLDYPEGKLLYVGPVHTYITHGHASIWNRYRAIRLIVNSIRIRSLSHLPQDPSQRLFIVAQQDVCQKNIDSLTDDLCGSVPFFFNSPTATGASARESRLIRIGDHVINAEGEILPKMAGLLAWPLTVAVSTEGVPEPQKQWLKRRLKTVAQSYGDAVLESVVEESQFRF